MVAMLFTVKTLRFQPPNPSLQPTCYGLRLRTRLSSNVEMTSAVKYQGDAGIGRAVGSSGLVPDFVGAGVIVRNAMGLCGGIPR
jgi:hypothetical protein